MSVDVEIRQDLEKKLKVIGWKLHHCGCEFYRIHNNQDKATAFLYRSCCLEIDDKESTFGREYGGCVSINLKKCVIEVIDGATNPFVSIRGGDDNPDKPAIFISFYGEN